MKNSIVLTHERGSSHKGALGEAPTPEDFRPPVKEDSNLWGGLTGGNREHRLSTVLDAKEHK